jgi:hypothetical protein
MYSTAEIKLLICDSSNLWIKHVSVDEIFASVVSDRSSEQRFKKLNFSQLQSPLLFKLIFFDVTISVS